MLCGTHVVHGVHTEYPFSEQIKAEASGALQGDRHGGGSYGGVVGVPKTSKQRVVLWSLPPKTLIAILISPFLIFLQLSDLSAYRARVGVYRVVVGE